MSADWVWTLLGTPPSAVESPEALPVEGWLPAIVPGTVASALALPLDHTADLDSRDWWYRTSFLCGEPMAPHRLHFGGLATIAEVWLNGQRLLRSRNMFVPRTADVTGRLCPQNELVMVFRALAPELAARRPRPRWKTALVEQQNLRFIRTTLLGRIPGWTARFAPVGPWREVTLEPIPELDLVRSVVHTGAANGIAGLTVSLDIASAEPVGRATLQVAGRSLPLRVTWAAGRTTLATEASLPGVALWWPHTHGEPMLHEAVLRVETTLGMAELPLGRLGFREVSVDRTGGAVTLAVNGVPVFARGACWTVDDPRALDGPPELTVATLHLAREAGANLIRVGGTMTYGSELFYRSCSELGLLVWQDLQFANFDYPFADPQFLAEVNEEVASVVARLHRHPCVSVYCGGSEVEQQAAMVGLPAAEWAASFSNEALPQALAAGHPGVPYFPSSPTGGAMPFSTGEGITHYYGVGAYRRPLTDVRRAAVRFTPECLGFSNMPDEAGMPVLPGGGRVVPHHPAWKAGVPRDNAAGWDFEDIRDHYLRELFGVDPVGLRYADPERYFALSRVVTGELMLRVYAEWRRPGSGCGGALVWFLKDLRPGAGWGVLDAANRPKPAYWYLKRAWARRAVLVTDEGLDGLAVHVVNEAAALLNATVELELLRAGRHAAGSASAPVSVPAFGALTLSGDAVFGRFMDLSYAYRFGPPRHDAVVVRLVVSGEIVHEDVFFPLGHGLPMQESPGCEANARLESDGSVQLTLHSRVLLQALAITSPGWEPEDNYFHLTPGRSREVRFRPQLGARAFKAQLSALNAESLPTVRLGEPRA